jgi:uncharacterized lipoprotein YajG
MERVFVMASAAMLVGCASQSANMQVGSMQSYASLKEQREAALVVKEYDAMPAGASVLGTVDSSRCHRNALDAAPDDAQLLADLKAAAYARGADGIAGVQKTKESGLLKNCWFVITARGTAFKLNK